MSIRWFVKVYELTMCTYLQTIFPVNIYFFKQFYFHNFFWILDFFYTTNSANSTTNQSGKKNSKMKFVCNQHSNWLCCAITYLFEVQQSIDHIQMSFVSCNPSNLTWYFSIQQYILPPHSDEKQEKRIRNNNQYTLLTPIPALITPKI